MESNIATVILKGHRVNTKLSPSYMAATQLEYRVVLTRRFGLVSFGGVGEVEPGADKFRNRHALPAGGTGIRFLLSKKFHLRTDFAWGKDNFT
jgi:outer membrane translocation and assembly module TamA